MSNAGMNIYAACRRRTGQTQEAWAEAIGISVESVKRYETYIRVPPNWIVREMVDLSGDESLAYRHLVNTSGSIGILPDLDEMTLQGATIKLMNRIGQFTDSRYGTQLMRISEDGIVSGEEQELYSEILDELREVVAAYYQLRYCTDCRMEVDAK